MDLTEEHSCALENYQSTFLDVSKLSDTLPSLSIDETNLEQEFFLKEHYEKVDRLRRENFDLKLKLYLLESNEKLTPDSELKFKIANELDRKNAEIKNLNEMLIKQNKEKGELKKLAGKHDKKNELGDVYLENKQLKEKLSEAIDVCANLVLNIEQLIQLKNGAPNSCNEEAGKLNSSQVCLDRATRFLSDKSIAHHDSSGNLKHILNRKAKPNGDIAVRAGVDPSSAKTKFFVTAAGHHAVKSKDSLRVDGQILGNGRWPECEQARINGDHMKIFDNLRGLIDDFRSNKVNYKDFTNKLDDLYESVDSQYRFREKLQLNIQENDGRLMEAERMLRNEASLKERIKLDLARSMKKLDLMISKTKQTA